MVRNAENVAKRITDLKTTFRYPLLMTMSDLRAVTFDAGGTMIYCDPSPAQIYASHLSRRGKPVGADQVGPVFRDAWAEMQRRTVPGKDRYSSVDGGERAWWSEFVREVLQRLDHDAPWEPLLDDLYAAFSEATVWKTFPDTAKTLYELAARGFRLAVVSNWDRRLPEILHSLDLLGNFDTVTVSSVEGVEKPSPEIFRRTLERLEVSASETVHVGDSPHEDYAGAEGAGIRAALIDRHGLFSDGPYWRISSLDELLAVVDG
jgi:putative hydrolase of the HAD superfamily